MENENKNRKKYDIRIQKTDKALITALFSLLKEKSLEDITVQSICDLASIRRATFYTHFNDKYELFGYAILCTYKKFPAYSDLLSETRTKNIYLKFIEETIDFIIQNSELIDSFKKNKLLSMMMSIITTEIIKEITVINSTYGHANLVGDTNPRLAINYYVKAVFGSIQWWIEDDYPISKEELTNQIALLLNFGN